MIRQLVLVIPLLFACPLSALAQEGLCVRIFRISTNNYPPLFFLDQDKKPAGLSHDLIAEIQKRMGCTFEEQGLPAPRAINDFSSYRTDMTGITPRFPPLEPFGEYIPLYKTARILVYRANKVSSTDSIQKVLMNKKLIFADQIGGSFFYRPSELEHLKKENRLIESPSPTSSYYLVEKGRADAFFSSPVLHHYYKRQKEYSAEMRSRPDPTHKLEVGLYISKKKITKTEREQILKALRDMKKDGTLKKILRSYLSEEDIPYYEDL